MQTLSNMLWQLFMRKFQLVYILVACVCVVLYSGMPAFAQQSDALLYLSPASAVVTIGETFTIDVLLDTGGQMINAAEGAITFNEDDLTLVSLDASGAIFSSWVEVPSYEADSGRITFSGVTGRVGYRGNDGRVVRVTFRALRNTASQVWFSQGAAVLSADGQASNVLSQLRSGTYTLTSREVVPSLAVVSESVPDTDDVRSPSSSAGPIRSSTHPTESGWYGTTTAFLHWDLPDDVQEIRTGLSTDSSALPTERHETVIHEYVVSGLPQGVAYFALQMRDESGWGAVYRYRLQSDIEPPHDLVLTKREREDPTDPEVVFSIGARDDRSGIASYAVSINSGRPRTLSPEEIGFTEIFETPGRHTVRLTAYDRAGNSTSTSTTVDIQALDTPRIVQIPDSVLVGSPLSVRGETYPSGTVLVSIRFNEGEAQEREVSADAQGVFVATIIDVAREGVYEIALTAVDERGARSQPTAPHVTQVTQPTLVLFGTMAINYISLFGALLGLVAFLVFLIWATMGMIRAMRRRVHTETSEAIEVLHTSFEDIKQDARSLVRVITKASARRPLTDEEELVIATMQKHLSEAEEHIAKEIKDIEETTHVSASAPVQVRLGKRTV